MSTSFGIAPVILQVEDREEDIYLLDRAFRQAGLEVRIQTATDGQQAVDYLAGKGRYADREQYPLPYLVLLDLKLPLRMGLDVLAWVRTQPSLRTLIVIVFSSSLDAGDVGRAYQLGANAFLVKPANFETLTEMCRAMAQFWFIYNEPPVGGAAP